MYDLIQASRGRDHAVQAAALTAMIRQRSSAAATLLDVACGTGAHLEHFGTTFQTTGVDSSPGMLARARTRCPEAELHEGDMRTFDLGGRFDAVTCLFSSIGYMLTVDDLVRAVRNMARHLNDGGVLVIEPWIHAGKWTDDYRGAEAANTECVAVSRVSVNGRHGHVSTFDLYWTVATRDGVEQFVEHHEMGLYSPAAYREAMEDAGLTVEHDPHGLIGRGLFIGVL